MGKAKYYKISKTHVVEVSPLDIRISVQDKPGSMIGLKSFVTSGYQTWEKAANGLRGIPLGILVSEGKLLSNRQPHKLPAGTLIVYRNGAVEVKPVLDITQEERFDEVYFAVSGCSVLPEIRMKQEGFSGKFADIARSCSRPLIGYNPQKDKLIIAVRPDTGISRGRQSLANLGCTAGITLDAGGSTVLKIDGRYKFSTSRQLYSVITWS